jgi:hypothetical protein
MVSSFQLTRAMRLILTHQGHEEHRGTEMQRHHRGVQASAMWHLNVPRDTVLPVPLCENDAVFLQGPRHSIVTVFANPCT